MKGKNNVTYAETSLVVFNLDPVPVFGFFANNKLE